MKSEKPEARAGGGVAVYTCTDTFPWTPHNPAGAIHLFHLIPITA